eukprot:2020984-Heterocapsa_arctica.AAC.1
MNLSLHLNPASVSLHHVERVTQQVCATANFQTEKVGFGGFDPNPFLILMVHISSKQQGFLRQSAPQFSVLDILSRETGCTRR